jgi:hypothetical protein
MRDAYDNGHVAGDDVTVDDDSVDDDTSLNADNGADDAEAGVVSWFGRGRAATCMVNRLFAAADDDDDNDAMDASSSTTSSSSSSIYHHELVEHRGPTKPRPDDETSVVRVMIVVAVRVSTDRQ